MKKTLSLLTLVVTSFFSQPSTASPTQNVTPNPDLTLIDTKADACEDYFQYACGDWLAKTEIPADRPFWGRSFTVIDEENQIILREILEGYSKGKTEPENPYAKPLGDFYASCMDTKKIESTGLKQMKEELKRIEAVKKETLPELIGQLQGRGVTTFFSFSESQDYKNPQEMIGEFHQGGMSLPTKDYYSDDSEKMKKIRDAYVAHISKTLAMTGVPKKQADKDAASVLALETKLAEAALRPAELRDPTKLYHRMDQAALKELAPTIDWPKYFTGVGVDGMIPINVTIPNYLKAASEVMQNASLPEIKAYLKIRMLDSYAHAMPEKFVKQNFDFYAKTFSGTKELPVRWKRCVTSINNSLGFALGRSYVKLKFAGQSKEIAKTMISNVGAELGEIIDDLPWMDRATKKAANEKLKSLANYVGFPDKWRNYDALKVERGSYLHNRMNVTAFNIRYDLDKIGKPVDVDDWDMVPSAANAYYHPLQAKMVFPAGILQPPFFHESYNAYSNYAGIGMVMGHEISHGFDDQGRQFDAKGAMRDWWTEKSSKEFNERAQCLAKQYNAFTIPTGENVNGQLTLGENIGDQGGVKIAYYAWKKTVPKSDQKNETAFRESQKRFFLAFAQSWCSKYSDAYLQTMVKTNPHAPARFRVNGPLMNFNEFATAYQCKEGSKMAPKNRCVVW